MPLVQHGAQQIQFKVVYYGPGLGGKTTNLEIIHRRSAPRSRGKLVSMNTEGERTLFFDLLPVELGRFKDYRVRTHLCTVPGQIAFDATRRTILRNVDGIVFVVDSQPGRLDDNITSLRNLERNLILQGDDPSRMPLVVQYNKRDLPGVMSVAALREALAVPPGCVEVEAIASRGVGVFDTFKSIIKGCMSVMGNPLRAPEGRTTSSYPEARNSSMFPEAAAMHFGSEASVEEGSVSGLRALTRQEPAASLRAPRVPRIAYGG